MNKIMLIITEQCNMNCIYCYEHKKNNSYMSFDTAVSIINQNLRDFHADEPWMISYFGGEPFLNFKLIKEIDVFLKQQYPQLYERLTYSIITNGTIINDEIRRWLFDHREIVRFQLSLDGFQEMHDRNRPMVNGEGSFSKIDLDFFKSLNQGLFINTVISPLSIPMLSDGIKWMAEQGFDCRAEFAIGIDWSNLDKQMLRNQIKELVRYYSFERQDLVPCLFLRKDMLKIYLPYNSAFRPCGVCREDKCYDTWGRLMPCNGMSFVSVGEKSKFLSKLKDDDFIFSDENICKCCEYVRVCKTCFAANYYLTGDLNKQSDELCYINKVCIYSSAEIMYNRLKGKAATEKEKQILANSIRVINDLVL